MRLEARVSVTENTWALPAWCHEQGCRQLSTSSTVCRIKAEKTWAQF